MEDSFLIQVFEKQKSKARTIKNLPVEKRIEKLKKIKSWILSHRQQIYQALENDFKKPAPEVDLTEIKPVLMEIDHASANLSIWTKPVKAKPPLVLTGTSSKIITEPSGVVLILSPWNFPFNLCLGPLISAIAASNTIFLKPSEFAPATGAIIAEMAKEIFPEDEVIVLNGDYILAEKLLKLPFNHIFFTGSPQIGKLVMKAAAENLASVTLELGGQNPVIVDETADLKDTLEKLVYGKCMNCGQSCVAPNYVFVHESLYEKFLSGYALQLEKMYGRITELKSNRDYGRIINSKHFSRLMELVEDAINKGAKVRTGWDADEIQNFMAPVVLSGVPQNARVMEEEIFGPVLPVIKYSSKKEITDFLSSREIPLAVYIFSSSAEKINFWIEATDSGTVAINETTLQFIHSELPFGGKNFSGIGKAHGLAGFKAFSNERAVFRQRTGFTSFKLIYPPYTKRVKTIIQMVMRYF